MTIKHFPGQAEGEEIQLLVRKHWIIDVKVALMTFITFVIPLIAFIIFVIISWPGIFVKWGGFLTVGILIVLLFVELILYIKWLNEELDLIIITNKRVINLDQVSFMERTVSETNLAQVQDVEGKASGVMGNVLDFGKLEIQTAAEKVVFRIKDVPHPFKTARAIMKLRDDAIEAQRGHYNPINPSQPWQQTTS